MKRISLPKRRQPPQPHHHDCVKYTWRQSREKNEYEYLPDFLEC